jgi:hypothetical protein
MVQHTMRRLACLLLLVSWFLTPDSWSQTRLGPLGPGLACNPTTYNPGTAPVTADCPLTPQTFLEGHATSCTINSTCGSTNDAGKQLYATAAGVTFTVPAPGGAGSAGYSFGYNGYAYSINASPAFINGSCGPTGTSLSGLAFGVSLTSDGVNWQCTPFVGTTPLTVGSSTGNTLAGPSAYFVCTAACTVTPPPPVAGFQFCVMTDDNVAAVITLGAISGVQYETTARTAYKAANTTIVSGGAVGDKICIIGRDATHYLTATYQGTWS